MSDDSNRSGKFFSQKQNGRWDSFTGSLQSDPLPEGLKRLAELASSRCSVSPQFKATLKHLSTPLATLVSVTTALPHPDAPRSILAYHLLTNQQLDDLARHYHQVWPPVPETFEYPEIIPAWIGTELEHTIDIETKRRRFGRFIGMNGCKSPVETSFPLSAHHYSADHSDEVNTDAHECRGIPERMEREWREALWRARMEDDSEILLRPKDGY